MRLFQQQQKVSITNEPKSIGFPENLNAIQYPQEGAKKDTLIT